MTPDEIFGKDNGKKRKKPVDKSDLYRKNLGSYSRLSCGRRPNKKSRINRARSVLGYHPEHVVFRIVDLAIAFGKSGRAWVRDVTAW